MLLPKYSGPRPCLRFAPKGPFLEGQFRAIRRKTRPFGGERGLSMQKAAFRPKGLVFVPKDLKTAPLGS
eukprot:1007134-Alexandrium_andersonii.AAC.1